MSHYQPLPAGEPITFTSATVVPAEGARVALVSCRRCGAALLIDPREEMQPIMVHIAWHEQQDTRKPVYGWANEG